jgi:flagellar assembly factor FliW
MSLTLLSTRFGSVEIDPGTVIEFDSGLIGLGGSRYALLASSPAAPFFWLHSLDDPALALPVTDPHRYFPQFRLELHPQDAERLDAGDAADMEVYVTVCASPDVREFVANLRAPIVIHAHRGAQVINQAPGMALRAPLFPGTLAASAA